MALGANTPVVRELGDINTLLVKAATKIYEGAAIGDDGAGYSRGLVAGDKFRGFAISQADNSAGAAGAVNVQAWCCGKVQLAIGSLAITDVGKDVYASDDGTFTLTATSNSRIGSVHRFVSTGIGIVEFDAVETVIARLTDNSGGTADGTIEAVGATTSDVSGAINNNFKELNTKINHILAHLAN